MKLKQLFCKHKRAKVIGTRIIETNTMEETAIGIVTYRCPKCGRVFEKEYNCMLPRNHAVGLKITLDGNVVAEAISKSIKNSVNCEWFK